MIRTYGPGNVLRKTRKHKVCEVNNRKSKNKKWFRKACNDKYIEIKIISKSFNRNPNNHFLRTYVGLIKSLCVCLCHI